MTASDTYEQALLRDAQDGDREAFLGGQPLPEVERTDGGLGDRR